MMVDPATFNIVTTAFVAIAREMSVDMRRVAFSSIIREAGDASTAVLDRNGNVIAQAENIPIHLNSMGPALRACLECFPACDLRPGEVLMNNDPYSGAQHLSDIFLFSPVFINGDIVAFSASTGHYADLGGSPGFNLLAKDVYQEKLRFEPMKFSIERDWNGGLLERIIRSNVRLPRDVIGDFNAQLTANAKGARRITDLIAKYGKDTVLKCMAGFMSYAEKTLRAGISSMRDGVFEGQDLVDDDGIDDNPIVIRVRLEVRDDCLFVDFAGSDSQKKTAINCPFASTVGAVLTAVKMILTDPELPFNDGFNAPVHVSAPLGSILNPTKPAPCEGRHLVVIRAFQALVKAFAHAAPDRVAATGFDTRTSIRFYLPIYNGYLCHQDSLGGGYGAYAFGDGESQLDDPLGNCRNTPVEAFETSQDYFRVIAYDLVQDSCGAGKYRGGLGARRVYEILEDDVLFTVASDRFKYRPEGLFGGMPGTCETITLHRDGQEIPVASKCMVNLRRGDIVEVRIGGGAGYGKPSERSKQLIEKDIREGKISFEYARHFYKY